MTEAIAQHKSAKRNVAVLSFMQAVLGAQLPVYIILGGLAGALLAEDKSLATLPIAFQMLVGMLTAAPISLLMGKVGRKPGFFLGAACGAVAGTLATYAILEGSFVLLCVAHGFAGAYQTTHNLFRFAATDAASDAYKPRAVSYVMAGGLVSAIIGPEIVIRFGDLFAPVPFAGAYATTLVVIVIGALAIPLLDLPPPPQRKKGDSGRPMREIFGNPAVPVAMLCAMVSYGVMTFVMTSTPLAIVACGFTGGQAADVVRWHVLAMFAPSFFTGSLIARFGHGWIIGIGLLMLATCTAISLSGVEIEKFYAALIFLGLGWNFGFIGATSLLAASHRPDERAKVQGLNDVLVMGLVAAGALSSGKIMDAAGWNTVNLSVLLPIGAALCALIFLALRKRRAALA
jgi:predicted MFS family arabinose efflux permease